MGPSMPRGERRPSWTMGSPLWGDPETATGQIGATPLVTLADEARVPAGHRVPGNEGHRPSVPSRVRQKNPRCKPAPTPSSPAHQGGQVQHLVGRLQHAPVELEGPLRQDEIHHLRRQVHVR